MNNRVKYLVPLLTGLAVLLIPLVRDFHIESAIIAAAVGAFWAGLSAAKSGKMQPDWRRATEILGLLYIAGVPLLIYALITGCYSVHGLGFWLFLPGPSVFLGSSIGRLIRMCRLPFPKSITVLILLLIALGGLLYEFLTLPHLYFFNHVWGYWPGPIYDEAVQFPLSLIGFRFLTFCWILILWVVPKLNKDHIYRWIVGLAALGLLLGYTQLERMRIITPDEYLQQQLGGALETSHSRLYYEDSAFSDQEIDQLGMEIEFYVSQIQQSLQIGKPHSAEKIEVYLYAHPWQKKELVGAKHTSYVTVWQQVPKVHIAREQVAGSLKHEIVHAVTALLEWPDLLPNIGLTEGIAVALAPDRSPRSTIDQLVAASRPYPSVEEMESSLSYWGFYTGRSAVSYTTAGSFVRYLIESRSPQQFVQAYQCGRVAEGYAEPFAELVAGWHSKLDSVRIDSSDQRRASEIFGQLSILEQQCPHKVPRADELFDRFLLSEARRDTAEILATLSELKALDPAAYSSNLLWMLWNLKAGNSEAVIEQADLENTRIEAQLLTADAYRLSSQPGEAQQFLHRALELAEQQSDSTFDEAFAARMDSLQWQYDMRIRFNEAVLSPSEFERAYYRSKIRAVDNLLTSDQQDPELLAAYAEQLVALPLDMKYFSDYLSLIHQLAYYRKFEMAERWIQKLTDRQLSLRFQERLSRQREWLQYLRENS